MKILKSISKDFRVPEEHEVDLKKWPTKVDPAYKSKEQYKKLLEEHLGKLSPQQQLLYASNRYALLLIFQAMDAAGKDGAIQHVSGRCLLGVLTKCRGEARVKIRFP